MHTVLIAVVLALSAGSVVPNVVRAEDPVATTAATVQHASRHRSGAGLEDRVALLARELDLDLKQQSEVRNVLLWQREQVKNVWDDTSAPAGYRIVATQAISDKTADRIRALLNDEQKKKYNLPKSPHETTAGSSLSVEDWMKKTQPK